MLISEHLL